MKNYLNFEGKTVVVTGGRRGIGRAIAAAFAERGASVVVIARNADAGELAEEAAKHGWKFAYVSCDLSDREARRGLIDRAAALGGGRVDVLVNNAGMQFSESVETCTQEQWDFSNSILLNAPFELAQQTIPYMKRQGGGKIINIASICAFREGGSNFSYGVMKTAVMGMTRCMSNSLASKNIQVNAIAPGIIRTDLTRGCFENEKTHDMQVWKYPAHRLGEPEEIASAALFLGSEMSSFVSGHTLVVDGGFLGN